MQLLKFIKGVLITAPFIVTTDVLVAAENKQIINVPENQMQWETTEEGVSFAPLQGDRFKEAYMAMVRLPAGLVSPNHIKTANMYGMVISGTITNILAGDAPSKETLLATGSFYKIPAGMAHISKCVSDVDCVTFLYQDGKFDFLPVDQ